MKFERNMELAGAFFLENSAVVRTPVPDFLRASGVNQRRTFQLGAFMKLEAASHENVAGVLPSG
jgi:hypothetical protein